MAFDSVEKARRGDRGAFEQLYRENVGRVYALCLRMSGEPGRAEELAQDVFIKAWRKLDSFRGDSAFSSWLYRIAVNEVYQAGRAESRRTRRIVTMDDPGEIDSAARSDEPGARIDLERAISRLPPGARTAFVLFDVVGYSHGEIAELTGTAEGTIKAQVHRARKLLRGHLER